MTVSTSSDDNQLALVREMAWRQTGYGPMLQLGTANFTDLYMIHQALLN